MNKKMQKKWLIVLHIILFVYSTCGILSKTAASQTILSSKFIVLYLSIILIMFIYALGWQQIIKHLSLTTAYSNKAVGIIWGMIFGAIIFDEQITISKCIGAILIIIGIVLFVSSDGDNKEI